MLNELLEYEENNDIGNLTRAERREFQQWISEALEQQPCEDTVSREVLKQELQEHLDFFVNAYGNFRGMSLSDKIRVDEITNCIAMVVTVPPVKPSYNSIKTELDHVIDEVIKRIEETRDKDKLCEYPYNRCIDIVREVLG